MRIILCIVFWFCASLLGCSKFDHAVEVPIPKNLENADPLIFELISKTADEVHANPKSVDAWALHASALLANAYYEKSVAASRTALSLDPSNRLPLRYRQAVTIWRLNQQDLAIQELEQILLEQPKYDFGWRRLASWYLELGRLEEARAAITRALDLEPNRPGTLATQVLILMQQGEVAEAITQLTPRLDVDDTPPYLYFLASQAYRRLGDTEALKKMAVKGEPLPKLWPDPWMNQIALLATGKRMLAINGLTLLRTKGPEAALPILAKAFNADPSNCQIRSAYAMSLYTLKREEESLKILDSLPNLNDATEEYWCTYANIAIDKAKQGNKDVWLPKAMDYFTKAKSISGGSVRLYISMARLATSINDSSNSIQYYLLGAKLMLEENNAQDAKTFLAEGITHNKGNDDLVQLYSSIIIE